MLPCKDSGDRALFGGRYLVGETLGQGGVAIVRRAHDTVTGREVALKELRDVGRADRGRAVELFRQEFHTLSQLAHPHVVSVYDYGLEAGAPYYTMELLDGGDLLDRVPYPWRTACALARDVCSALSLIHSRRMVYRDLSPKNVRCTSDGRAKLLDFGALCPMGPVKSFVGTPAISPPEAVHLQPLDARADLYSLGATLYYALTGKRPFPAGALNQLGQVWKKGPPPPSTFAPDVPPALDGLVMALIQLDRAHRPASAAETFDRLAAVAGLERDEGTLLVSKAYLTTPMLVGRESSLEQFRESMTASLLGAGRALLVDGVRGAGRTRFVDACALEARMTGALVLAADATDAALGDYGVARALAEQLVGSAPEIARACAAPSVETLRVLVPSLGGSAAAATEPSNPQRANELQRALREWFLAVATGRPVVVVVDDVDRIDPPSAALVALLGREAADHPLLVVASLSTAEDSRRSDALALLAAESREITLLPLGIEEVEHLCRSLFGDVPNVQLAAHRLHAVSGGLPRDLMQLAQHMVDTGLARYSSGSWSLPHRLDESDLPSDMTQARRARLDALGGEALRLAQAFALGPDGRFSFGECVALTDHGDAARLMPALDELVQAEIVTISAKDYALSGLGFREPLLQSVAAGATRGLYLKLAHVCDGRPGQGFRAAQYLLDAGEEERGLDALVSFSEASIRETADSMATFERLLASLPADWFALYDRGLELCRKYGRPTREALILQTRATGIASQLPVDAAHYFAPLFAELSSDAGLDIYESLDPALPNAVRLKRSMELAAERRASTPGKETSYTPEEAIQWIGRRVSSVMGSIGASLSVELLQVVPSLRPLATLSPAFVSWQLLVEGVGARVLGRSELARRIYEVQLERLAQPDGGGLEETYRLLQYLGIEQMLGFLEASAGLEKSLERAERLESRPLYRINSVRIRMLYAVWQGDVLEADRRREEAELLSIERGRRQAHEGSHLLRELLGYSLLDDLTRVKRTLDAIEPLSRSAVGWQAVRHWAHAEYQRIRGNLPAALEHVRSALSAMHPAGHPIWSEAAGTHVRILVVEGRFAEAAAAGLSYLEEAERRLIGYEQNYIRMPLAVAFARLGKRPEAEAHADLAIASFVALGSKGLNLALAYETRAQVALYVAAPDHFREFMRLGAEQCGTGVGGSLAARYERLSREAQLRNETSECLTGTTAESTVIDTMTIIEERLGDAPPAERARRALDLLLESSGASEGFLFGLENGKLVLAARNGPNDLPDLLAASAQAYFVDQCSSDHTTLESDGPVESDETEWTIEGQYIYRPVVLSHAHEQLLEFTGLALLRTQPSEQFRYPATTALHLSQLTARAGGPVQRKRGQSSPPRVA